MKSPVDIIIELESDNSRLYKESIIIDQMKNGNTEFFEGVRFACDKLITFGVSEKSIPEKDGISDVDHISFSDFKIFLQKLINRELTGNSAKDALLEICNKTSNSTWIFWYRRILLKDLKCGVDTKTINNCAKKSNIDKYSIPIFSCQLAFDSNLHEKKMLGKKIVDCLSENWKIKTNFGYMTIKDIVESDKDVDVESFNHINNCIEYNRVTGKSKIKNFRSKWFVITLEDGTKTQPLTGNHLVWCENKKNYIRVDELTEEDYLLSIK